jgi:hypothetical protein
MTASGILSEHFLIETHFQDSIDTEAHYAGALPSQHFWSKRVISARIHGRAHHAKHTAYALLVRCYRSAALEEQARASLRDPAPPHLNTLNNFRYTCAYKFKIVKASSKPLISKGFVDNAGRLVIH